jgi:hypothetical protein
LLGQRHAKSKVSVVITAGSSQQNVLELLDHLRSHDYTPLEIIVIPRARSKPKKSAYLREYAASHKRLNLQIVTSRQRLTQKIVSSQYASGKAIVWLQPTERLPKNFFKAVAYEFLSADLDELSISPVIVPGASLASSLAAWSSIRRYTLRRRGSKKGGYTVYRRSTLATGRVRNERLPHTQLVSTRPYASSGRLDWLAVSVNSVLAFLVAYILLLTMSSPWLFVVAAAIAAYMVSNILWMLAVPAYSPLQKFMLLLCLPFALMSNALNYSSSARHPR